MNKLKTILSSIVIITLLFSSCQMEKRHYMSGYSFQWNKNKHTSEKKPDVVKAIKVKIPVTSTETVAAKPEKAKEVIPSPIRNEERIVASNDNSVSIVPEARLDFNNPVKVTPESTPAVANSSHVNVFKAFFKRWIGDNTAAAKPAESGKTNTMALLSLIFGILGIITFIVLIGYLFAILAIIFGILGLSQIKSSGESGSGMAIAGIICGAIPILILIFVIILFAALFSY